MMKIKDAFVGMLIKDDRTENVGWIKGLMKNTQDELIFMVRWAGDIKTGMPEMDGAIHPGNVERLK